MALLDNTYYVDSVGYAAVTAWATGAAKSVGVFVRPTAPSVGNERVYIALNGGTTHGTTQPTWPTTRGGKVTDNDIVWQEVTGLAGVNGDITNTPTWDQYKAATSSGTLGQLIKNNAGTHLFAMSTAGTIGAAQPTFDTTAGNTTVDNAATWTCIGAVADFTGNQAPHARMANALTANWNAAGNTIYVKSSHAETQSTGITLAGASTLALPQRWLCHDGGAYPPQAVNIENITGASITSSAAGINITAAAIEASGFAFITSAATQSITTGSTKVRQKWRSCTFTRGASAGTLLFGNASTENFPIIELENPTFSFANVNNTMAFTVGDITVRGGQLAGAAVPTTLINIGANPSCVKLLFEGADLSALGAGKTIVGALGTVSGLYRFVNCKLGASVTPASTPSTPHYRVEFINCDSGATNYLTSIYDYAGTLTTEIGVVRTGGASDGTTPISWKIVTTANAKFDQPFKSPPIGPRWFPSQQDINNGLSLGNPVTLTIQGIWGDGAVPTDEDIWVEVEYLGASGSPIASFVSDAKATVLSTPAGQDAGSGTWGGSTTKFALAVTFTPQMAGPIIARVKCGKASATLYVDPAITLS